VCVCVYVSEREREKEREDYDMCERHEGELASDKGWVTCVSLWLLISSFGSFSETEGNAMFFHMCDLRLLDGGGGRGVVLLSHVKGFGVCEGTEERKKKL